MGPIQIRAHPASRNRGQQAALLDLAAGFFAPRANPKATLSGPLWSEGGGLPAPRGGSEAWKRTTGYLNISRKTTRRRRRRRRPRASGESRPRRQLRPATRECFGIPKQRNDGGPRGSTEAARGQRQGGTYGVGEAAGSRGCVNREGAWPNPAVRHEGYLGAEPGRDAARPLAQRQDGPPAAPESPPAPHQTAPARVPRLSPAANAKFDAGRPQAPDSGGARPGPTSNLTLGGLRHPIWRWPRGPGPCPQAPNAPF